MAEYGKEDDYDLGSDRGNKFCAKFLRQLNDPSSKLSKKLNLLRSNSVKTSGKARGKANTLKPIYRYTGPFEFIRYKPDELDYIIRNIDEELKNLGCTCSFKKDIVGYNLLIQSI